MAGESCRIISGLFWTRGLKKLKTDPRSELPEVVTSSSGFCVVTTCGADWKSDVN